MKTASRIILAVILLAISALLNIYVQPLLDETQWGWFSIAYIFIIPTVFLIVPNKKYTPIKYLVILTGSLLLLLVVADLFQIDKFGGKCVATFCGAAITYLILKFGHRNKQ